MQSQELFEENLKRRGLCVATTTGDGNCFFRAISITIHGNENEHENIRAQATNYIVSDSVSKNEYFPKLLLVTFHWLINRLNWKDTHADDFKQFLKEGETIKQYIERKRRNGVYANEMEIAALSKAFSRTVEIYKHDAGKFTINP